MNNIFYQTEAAEGVSQGISVALFTQVSTNLHA
jgi:hypothetical protein